MLNYFRINDPYRLLVMLAILVVMFLALLVDSPDLTYPELKSLLIGKKVSDGFGLYTGVIDSVAPLTGWFYGLLDLLFGESLTARHIVSFVLIFLQAIFFGMVMIHRRAFAESNFVPSFLYGILFLFSFDTISLTGDLLALTFLLFALNGLFTETQQRNERSDTVLNVGVFTGMASLCEFSFAVYLIAAALLLAIYTRSSARKFLLLLVGFVLPHALLMSVYYLNGETGALVQYYYLPNLGFDAEKYFAWKDVWVFFLVPLFFVMLSLLSLSRFSGFTKYQSQLLQVMFFWMIFSFLQIFYGKIFKPQSFISLVPCFAFFISHFLLNIRRRNPAEFSLWILMLGITAITYLNRYTSLLPADYDRLIVREMKGGVRGKKLVVLEDNVALYAGNTPATPFLNWKLAEEIFEHPEYYESAIAVYEGFRNDPPDVIVDPKKLMRPFFERIPELQKKYKPTADGYQRK